MEQLNIKLEEMLPEKERDRDLVCDALRKEEVVIKTVILPYWRWRKLM
jgi:hypothetical protein